jgi:hypothetical protein
MNTALLTPNVMQESSPTLLPITERLLNRLPGPRWLWLLLWGCVPLVRGLTFMPLWNNAAHDMGLTFWQLAVINLVNVLVWAYAIWLSLWSVRKVVKDVKALDARLAGVLGPHGHSARSAFRGMESWLGPLLSAATLTLVFSLQTVLFSGWLLALLNLPLLFLIYLPVATWFWSYLMLMLGLHRLGKQHLELESYAGDKSMGLRPVGSLAFSGFGMFAAILGPIVLVSMTDVLGLTVGLLFFVIGVTTFFLSLYRIHRQMAMARKGEMAKAHELYVKAYEPLRFAPSLELLQKQAPLLSAAEALEKRLEGIQTWPFSDAVLVRIVAIASSVVTAIIVKLLLKPLGM